MKKIIAIEDIIRLPKKEQSFLDRSGFVLLPAASNEDILAVHKKEKADLIVASLNSAPMSGEKLCSIMREAPEMRAVSIIIVCPPESDSDISMACNANAFLSSPVNPAILLQEMHRLLNIAARGFCRVPLKINLEGKKTKASFSGLIENISASGMLFSSGAELFEGDTITCLFSLPGSGSITAEAEIVRIIEKESQNKQNLYGISFTDPDNNLISAIEKFINVSENRA
ncbi:MAG: PilZ domain-containing protein [Thermodesulfovibrionales bacterium]|nr:PilZ domain-containing protein [Thermodesulfovibrionales bacterium]